MLSVCKASGRLLTCQHVVNFITLNSVEFCLHPLRMLYGWKANILVYWLRMTFDNIDVILDRLCQKRPFTVHHYPYYDESEKMQNSFAVHICMRIHKITCIYARYTEQHDIPCVRQSALTRNVLINNLCPLTYAEHRSEPMHVRFIRMWWFVLLSAIKAHSSRDICVNIFKIREQVNRN